MIYGRKGIYKYIYTHTESTPYDPLLINERLLVATVTATVGATTAQVDVTLLFQGEVLEDLSGFCTALWVLWGVLQVGFFFNYDANSSMMNMEENFPKS